MATAVLMLLVCTGPVAALQEPKARSDAGLVPAFLDQIQTYITLHKKLEATLPPLPEAPTTAQLEQHQRALQRLISRARADARPGDIFTDPVRSYFRRQLAKVFSGPGGPEALRSVMDENPRNIRVTINGRYPDGAPVANMPPPVLLVLPNLPRELEYRFVGVRLVLLDIHADMVIDYIDKAIIL